jgi:organic hydroperoxide reductase OsmC/OhrA
MAQATIHVRTVGGVSAAIGWSGPRTVTIDRPESAGGLGIGFSGGELLLLAVGACYTNDLYREAAKMGMALKGVNVDVEGDWGGNPVRAQNVTYSVKVESSASEADILELIKHTDEVAEIHNSLRLGTKVTLTRAQPVK